MWKSPASRGSAAGRPGVEIMRTMGVVPRPQDPVDLAAAGAFLQRLHRQGLGAVGAHGLEVSDAPSDGVHPGRRIQPDRKTPMFQM